ncbi:MULTISPECIES: SDR family oxidoreductase [Bacillaceae]|uniref:SDR family oxidoreductase n=1 Tax=Bacillaceae TaxID=186817 RepID=UPI0004755618|nr:MULTISPECIES: SDR family oxidoreductase [Bacillaceae]
MQFAQVPSSTPMTEEMLKARPTDKIPLNRFGQVDEVAELAVFLASDESKFMNRAMIPIDGGYTMERTKEIG